MPNHRMNNGTPRDRRDAPRSPFPICLAQAARVRFPLVPSSRRNAGVRVEPPGVQAGDPEGACLPVFQAALAERFRLARSISARLLEASVTVESPRHPRSRKAERQQASGRHE